MSLACSDVSGYVASQCFVSVALKSTHADHAEPVWLTERRPYSDVMLAEAGQPLARTRQLKSGTSVAWIAAASHAPSIVAMSSATANGALPIVLAACKLGGGGCAGTK